MSACHRMVVVEGVYVDIRVHVDDDPPLYVYRSPLGLLYLTDDPPGTFFPALPSSTAHHLMDLTDRLLIYRRLPDGASTLGEQAARCPVFLPRCVKN